MFQKNVSKLSIMRLPCRLIQYVDKKSTYWLKYSQIGGNFMFEKLRNDSLGEEFDYQFLVSKLEGYKYPSPSFLVT